MNDKTHWSHELFVEHPELHLPFLEAARGRAAGEVNLLASRFENFGVPHNGKVVDLCCGTGRHSVLLAERGYRVVGIDISPLYLERAAAHAREAGVSPHFLQGDVNELTPLREEAPFAAMINMLTSHGYHGQRGDLDLFSTLRELAAPRALLVVNTANRDALFRHFEPFHAQEAGGVVLHACRRLDLETSTMHNTWKFYEQRAKDLVFRLQLEVDHRVYSLHELRRLLEDSGWRFLEGLGMAPDASELLPLTYDHFHMWVLAQAP